MQHQPVRSTGQRWSRGGAESPRFLRFHSRAADPAGADSYRLRPADAVSEALGHLCRTADAGHHSLTCPGGRCRGLLALVVPSLGALLLAIAGAAWLGLGVVDSSFFRPNCSYMAR